MENNSEEKKHEVKPMTKYDILKKYSVRPMPMKDILDAMDEYATQLKEENRNLKTYLNEIIELKGMATSTQELFPLLQYINKVSEALSNNQIKET